MRPPAGRTWSFSQRHWTARSRNSCASIVSIVRAYRSTYICDIMMIFCMRDILYIVHIQVVCYHQLYTIINEYKWHMYRKRIYWHSLDHLCMIKTTSRFLISWSIEDLRWWDQKQWSFCLWSGNHQWGLFQGEQWRNDSRGIADQAKCLYVLASFLDALKGRDSVLWKCELVLLCILQTW